MSYNSFLESRHNVVTNPPLEESDLKIYRDINLNLSRNPITNDITTITDIMAVKKEITNLLYTQHHERPFHPEIGSALEYLLFEPIGPITANRMQRAIVEVLSNYIERIDLTGVQCIPREDSNAYDIIIHFYVLNKDSGEQILTTMLEVA